MTANEPIDEAPELEDEDNPDLGDTDQEDVDLEDAIDEIADAEMNDEINEEEEA